MNKRKAASEPYDLEMLRIESYPVPRVAARPTVIVPAYNEVASIADTIASIQAQTAPVAEILVVDDCSTDGTGEVARRCGARVIRPQANTGSKAGAQTFALDFVDTPHVLAIDADTTLAPDAIERLSAAFEDSDVVAACGLVLPRYVRTIWERGRYVEYVFAFSFYKLIQDHYGVPLISSGCFSMYRTDVLRAHGGWSNRTMAEDMDLTWQFYQCGHKVRFVPEAACWPIEPHNFHFMRCQLRRWAHGFVQNVRVHWRGILDVAWLRAAVAVAVWDSTVASIAFLFALPVLAALVSPLFLLGYLVDIPAVLVPVLWHAWRHGEVGRALASLPGFLVLRALNSFFLLAAAWSEVVRGRRLDVYEKGH
jgi:cellulose synthase/poly-beta-1,6-N-acetylglucosamine synthase-like glycosyltransferase